MKTTYEITSGPSKMELFDSMKYCCSTGSKVKIYIGIHVPGSPSTKVSLREIIVTSISLEDGSGESFNISGDIVSHGQRMSFKGWYRTDSRKGTLTLGN